LLSIQTIFASAPKINDNLHRSAASIYGPNAQTGSRRLTVTGTGGIYQIPVLPIGSYTVTFFKEGFEPGLTAG
jgi:hypothetical protein